MILRNPSPSDYPRILHLLERAFAPSISEAELVKNLRDRNKIACDFVLEEKGRILAYVCYTSAYDNSGTKIGFHLAPVAVMPGNQRRGLGQRIVRESLSLVGSRRPVYVLGDREYYGRFGFKKDRSQKCPFDPEGAHFMVLTSGPLPPRDVLYEDEFTI